ncbi:MAG: basic secretory protein-like protein [Reichenbachiella sp.]|uniref:basic secretory protein-like protein n=1 Tax=Reichenbachiella sp. TaxID=2184521 RepID=UPI003296F54D
MLIKTLRFLMVAFFMLPALVFAQSVDLTNDGGNVTAEYNDSPNNEGISKLIDNSSTTKYLTFHANAWVQYQATTSYVVTKYVITSANDVPARDPYSWTLQGSNDGVNFSTIDSRSGQDFPNRFQSREFTFSNAAAYTYYRLDMTNNSGNILQLAELAIWGEEAVVASDFTDDGGIVSAEYSDSPNNEGISKLIDNTSSSKYLTFHSSGWVQYQANSSYVLSSYTITSANDVPQRDPYSWTLSGSNNGVNFTQIDSRTGEDFANRFQTKTYQVSNSIAYTHYRLDMNNNSGNILQLAELELFGSGGSNNTQPVANFSANSTSVNEGGSVTFSNQSTNATSYEWEFPGGSPSSSTSASPVVTYASEGNYSVTLRAHNANGTDVETKSNYISVTASNNNCDWGNQFLTPNVIFTDYDGVTTGSQIFHQVIANPESYMQQRCLDVAKILYRHSSEAPRFRQLTFELKNEDFVAYKWGDGDAIGIAVSTQHLTTIYNQSGGNAQVIKDEIDGILFHEVTHGYNNSPITGGTYDGQSPFWAYTEGIADAVRIHAGFHQTRQPDPNNSRKWLGGYTTTGFFLHYISQTFDKNFVYNFNEKAKSLGQSWSFDAALLSIIGQDAQTTWNQYANFINGGGYLDYDGNYPWELDCPNNFIAASGSSRIGGEIKEDSPLSAVNVWPNPVSSDLNIQFGAAATGVIRLYQSAGLVVAELALTEERSTFLPVDQLKPGIYILKIQTDIEVSSQKIIVE